MIELNFDPHSERIELAHRRLEAAYRRRPGHEVPVVEPYVYPKPETTEESVADLDRMLEQAVCWANSLAATDNDWPPVILGFCSVVMVPEAFGCEVVFHPGQSPWARHALGDIKQVWKLKPKKMNESTMIRRQIEWIDYAQRRLGTDIPIQTLDIQSPFSVAAQIVEPDELLSACLTSPREVHHLCRMVTDYSIEMMRKQFEIMEHPGFPGANFPSISKDIGICIADDTPLIMLSPEMYREFALPYNCRLGEIFGGIHIHSCGDYRHNLDNLLEITNIRSIQVHAGQGEFPLPESAGEDCPFNRARKKLAFFVDVNDIAQGDEYRGRYKEHYTDYVLPGLRAGDLTGCILQSCGCPPTAGLDDLNEALSWTRRQISVNP